ncbi:hypothetical protein BKE38_08730 [Pseudoroseomonas deserti]|uniref:Uncharacterized protein n=1 Tax=Teichococcus deserti TaxID=1817963 RepID=A0A1V2H4W5_9PROT|nr:hypothetical protein [Pseudoroseomonas deserti]ONG55742.1 hypothetical protein BKE38_08730 [Pseudoroseomonas deserti]
MSQFRLYAYLHMGSNVGVAIAGAAGHLGRLNRLVDQTNGKLTALGRGLVAAGAMLASARIADGLWDAVKAGGELLNMQNRLRTQGWTNGQVGRATVEANRIQARVGNVNTTEIMSLQGNMMQLFNDEKTANTITPLIAQLQSTMRGSGMSDSGLEQLLKAIEMRGAIYSRDANGNQYVDVDKFRSELDWAWRALNSSNGTLKPEDIFQMVSKGGMFAQSMNQRAFWGMMSELASSTSGSTAGTQMMAVGQQVLFGTMTKQRRQMMESLGYKFDRRGGMIGEDRNRFQNDTFEALWDLQDRVRKRTRRNAGESDDDYDNRVALEAARYAGRSTSQRLFLDVIKNRLQYENNSRRADNSMSLQDSHALLRTRDLNMALGSLSATWESFKQLLGVGVAQDFAYLINGFTSGLSAINAWMTANPGATRNIMRFALGFTGALTLLAGAALVGGIVLAASAFSGLIAAAATAAAPVVLVAGAVAGLAVWALRVDWRAVGGRLRVLWDQFRMIASGIGNLITRMGSAVWAKLQSVGTTITGALTSLWGKVGELWTQLGNTWIGGLVGSVTGWLGQITSAFVGWVSDLWSKIKELIPSLPGASPALTPNQQRLQDEAAGIRSRRGGSLGSRSQDLMQRDHTPGPQSSRREEGGFNLASNVMAFQPRSNVIQVHTSLQLDKREIGRTVTEHQVQEAQRAGQSRSGFDPNMSFRPRGGAIA